MAISHPGSTTESSHAKAARYGSPSSTASGIRVPHAARRESFVKGASERILEPADNMGILPWWVGGVDFLFLGLSLFCYLLKGSAAA